MKLDMIKDARVDVLRDMIGYKHRLLNAGKGSSHHLREEIRALSWTLTLIRHAAERDILDELEREAHG